MFVYQHDQLAIDNRLINLPTQNTALPIYINIMKFPQLLIIALLTAIVFVSFHACTNRSSKQILDHSKIAKEYFQEDFQWYLDNIPFFECSDITTQIRINFRHETRQVLFLKWSAIELS